MKGLKIKIAKILKANYIRKSEAHTSRVRGWHTYSEGYTYDVENKWDKGNEIFYLTYYAGRNAEADKTLDQVSKVYQILCDNGLSENLELQGNKILLKR
jgi:hypothetical protein